MIELRGRRALVCGSTKGIGRACAVLLATAGARVTLLARDEAALRGVCAALPRAAEGEHDFRVADFSDPGGVGTAGAAAAAAGPVHVLVNNTGGPPGGPIVEAGLADFERALRQHVGCNHALVQALLPGMRAAGYGRIINIVSTSVREPIPNLGVSNTTRAAVAGWAKTLARELAPLGITVNNVLPGFTDTERLRSLFSGNAQRRGTTPEAIAQQALEATPMGRFATAEEVAAAVLFLASPLASYITGVSLPVDGGRMASI